MAIGVTPSENSTFPGQKGAFFRNMLLDTPVMCSCSVLVSGVSCDWMMSTRVCGWDGDQGCQANESCTECASDATICGSMTR